MFPDAYFAPRYFAPRYFPRPAAPEPTPASGNIVMRRVYGASRPRRIIAGVPVYDDEEEAILLALMETLLND